METPIAIPPKLCPKIGEKTFGITRSDLQLTGPAMLSSWKTTSFYRPSITIQKIAALILIYNIISFNLFFISIIFSSLPCYLGDNVIVLQCWTTPKFCLTLLEAHALHDNMSITLTTLSFQSITHFESDPLFVALFSVFISKKTVIVFNFSCCAILQPVCILQNICMLM